MGSGGAMIKLVTLFILTISAANAGNMIKVRALGASPKGQFIAFEEFGYLEGNDRPFSKIRVKNVWKDHYVDRPVKVVSEEGEMELDQVRAKARSLAKKKLEEFNIST